MSGVLIKVAYTPSRGSGGTMRPAMARHVSHACSSLVGSACSRESGPGSEIRLVTAAQKSPTAPASVSSCPPFEKPTCTREAPCSAIFCLCGEVGWRSPSVSEIPALEPATLNQWEGGWDGRCGRFSGEAPLPRAGDSRSSFSARRSSVSER